ncbi:hypothetical protein DFH09DRAFT_1395071 [Mycena vulgaris]|nr:hypothetical protein DFH09DRAFT_1395071 [Mycena vulgaris]
MFKLQKAENQSCITSEQPPQNPCERCTRRQLACEYVASPDQRGDSPPDTSSSHRHRTDMLDAEANITLSPAPVGWTAPLTAPDFSQGRQGRGSAPSRPLTHPHPLTPPATGSWSSSLTPGPYQPLMYPGHLRPPSSASSRRNPPPSGAIRPPMHPQFPTPPLPGSSGISTNSGHDVPAYYNISQQQSLPLTTPQEYDLQAARAHQYLAARQAGPSSIWPAMGMDAQSPGYAVDYGEAPFPGNPSPEYGWREDAGFM